MISTNQKELALWLRDYLLRHGVQACRIGMYSGTDSSFEVRDGKIEHLQQAEENQLIGYLFVDGRYGSFSTNRLNKEELEHFFSQAIVSTRLLAVDEARHLPDGNRYFKGSDQFLSLYDPDIAKLDPDFKLKAAFDAAAEIDRNDARIISVASAYGDNESFTYLIDSNGLEIESASSSCGISVSISVQGEGDARPEAYWYDQALSWKALQKEGIGVTALDRALMKIGQRKIQSAAYPMVVEKNEVRTLLSPLLNALSGAALQQNNSFLIGKQGHKVGSDKLNLIDNPLLPHTIGARGFDREGIALKPLSVFDHGILQNYYIDTYNAHKLGVDPTTGSPSVLQFNLGDSDRQALLKHLDTGILITGFNGGNCNSSTGNFSYGIEGFWVEKGDIQFPIGEMNLTGNMLALWNHLVEVGNDPMKSSGWQTPSLLFDAVDFSGI
ncbi:TldD/PmbA family protein [Microbacter margulisiae]|uniref:PmbA protein n=1 Tax=Microbacter margulisiae TaxID=1350067 RepID=A0A7W5DSR4_9PORP|nr:TldD/PmbA family protein [Microbacter margulisiae]MBB3188395.1 PmbA protein [Microbacter margulisiae]